MCAKCLFIYTMYSTILFGTIIQIGVLQLFYPTAQCKITPRSTREMGRMLANFLGCPRKDVLWSFHQTYHDRFFHTSLFSTSYPLSIFWHFMFLKTKSFKTVCRNGNSLVTRYFSNNIIKNSMHITTSQN